MSLLRTCVSMAAVLAAAVQAQDVAKLMAAVQDGPSLYRTPEAVEYFSARKPDDRASYSEDREGAVKSLRSAILLGERGSEAADAIPALVEKFPQAQHVVLRSNVQYTRGNGTFEAWVQTYALSEKTKFLIGASLLEYATLSKCDEYITVATDPIIKTKRGTGASMTEATADIYVIFTVNAGACALAQLTGESVGTDAEAWRQWYARVGGSYVPASPASSGTSSTPISKGGSLDDVVVKGKYRIVLSTGDEFTGTIESTSGEKLIIETEKGEPYQFDKSMVVEHELLEAPKRAPAPVTAPSGGITESRIYSFDELRRDRPIGTKLSLRVTSGASFVGTLSSITDDQLKLNVDGSEIPFGKEAISQISSVVEKPSAPRAADVPASAPDTIVVRNPQTDEYGRPLKAITYAGTIMSDKDNVVVLKLTNGQTKKIAYADIVRRISHSVEDEFAAITRYGKSLMCPQGMMLVNVPPGKAGRPFFKVCIDKYEAPSKEGAVPTGNISYQDAMKKCEAQGKRLCTSQEWQFACSGLEEYPYPYGADFKQENCNGEGNARLEPSGTRIKCISKFGVYDMVGNIFEWVTGKDGAPMLMGGPMSKCQTLSPGVGGQAKPVTGYRCCKGN